MFNEPHSNINSENLFNFQRNPINGQENTCNNNNTFTNINANNNNNISNDNRNTNNLRRNTNFSNSRRYSYKFYHNVIILKKFIYKFFFIQSYNTFVPEI